MNAATSRYLDELVAAAAPMTERERDAITAIMRPVREQQPSTAQQPSTDSRSRRAA